MTSPDATAERPSDQPRATQDGSDPVPSGPILGDGGLIRGVIQSVLRRRVPLLLAIHVSAFAAIFPLAYLIRFDGAIPELYRHGLVAALPWVIAIKLMIFLALRSHRGWWRYATFADVVALVETSTLATLAIVVCEQFFPSVPRAPRSVLVLDWAGTVLLLGGIRCSTRLFRERYYPMIAHSHPRPALVVGASEAALSLVRLLQTQQGLGLRVVGLIAEDRLLLGRTLGGVKVVGTMDRVIQVATAHRVRTVLVPTPAVGPNEIRSLVTDCSSIDVQVQVVPGFDALLKGDFTLQPRDVDIHDLLCREPVKLDDASVARFLRGRVVLVTGAAGSIGSEVCRQVLAYRPRKLVLLDHSENGLFFVERELAALRGEAGLVPKVASITDAGRIRDIFETHRPDVVFHAAAHKHVPMMEANPGEAVKNNVFGTRNLVDEAVRAGAEAFVMISTDKAVRASSVMGACKRLAEMYVQARSSQSSTRLVTVRFGNVLGSNGSVVPLFKEQIRRGGPVTVTHPEMTRYFMTIPEATQLVLEAGALGSGGEIFVLDMGTPVRILDLARDLIRLSGLTEGREIGITFTGLRPGEKLHEELYDKQEKPLATPHPKIFNAQHRPCEIESIEARLWDLGGKIDGTDDEVLAALRDAVPDYRPGPRPVEDLEAPPRPAPMLGETPAASSRLSEAAGTFA